MTPVWVYVDQSRARPWCVLVRAIPGGRIVTLCAEFGYDILPISTDDPDGLCCVTCTTRLGSRSTASAAEPYDEISVARAETVDLEIDETGRSEDER